MSVVDWVCKKISLESASERLSAITISRQQCFPASLTHAQTLPLAVKGNKMAANKKVLKKRGGRYCAAGTPNQESCKNTSYTPGITMHLFPTEPKCRAQWIKFVQRHRVDFGEPINQYASLCSVHFVIRAQLFWEQPCKKHGVQSKK